MKYFIMFCLSLVFQLETQAQKSAPKPKTSVSKYLISHKSSMEKLNQLSPEIRDSSCWIFAATMMYSWKNKVCTTPAVVAAFATKRSAQKNNYTNLQSKNQGLPASQGGDFGAAMGWKSLNYSPTVEGIYNILVTRGPLYFAHNPYGSSRPGGHALVIIGLKSPDLKDAQKSLLEVFDPWNGAHLFMTFNEYAEKYFHRPSIDGYLFHY